jgi:hypothetical protein
LKYQIQGLQALNNEEDDLVGDTTTGSPSDEETGEPYNLNYDY